MLDRFLDLLTPAERELFLGLDSPLAVQRFLDDLPYSAEDANRCPLQVLRDRVAHCLDGALFAAAALWRLGHPPLILDLLPEPGRDDDHVLAIYRVDGHYGAVAKSNYVGLRFREPIHRTLRELALSYFEAFYNVAGEKTLRGYTRPLDLRREAADWLWTSAGADRVYKRLLRFAPIPLLTPAMVARLSPVDSLSYAAMMTGANPAGLYRPSALMVGNQ
ncbi:MAG: hypothetical protein N2383_06990 [Caldilineales bacterium]|nr:hypothetical protein [Caldilineales bacterium]